MHDGVDQLTDFERRLQNSVREYLADARLELAPAIVVADVLARPVGRRWSRPRNILLALAAATAVVIVASMLLPFWRPALLPPAATPRPSAPAQASPSAAASPRPSASPGQTSTPTGSPASLVNPVIPGPQQLPDRELLAGGARVHFTNIRRFALGLPPVVVSALGPLYRAIDENRLAVTVYDRPGSSSTWLVDLQQLEVTRLSDLQLVDITAGGDRLLMAGLVDGERQFEIIDSLTGHVEAQIAAHGTSHAAFLADGTVALATGDSIGIWDGVSYRPINTATAHLGAFDLIGLGQHVIAKHGGANEFFDAQSGQQLVPAWQGPQPLRNLDGTNFAAFVAGQSSPLGVPFELELHDSSTGQTILTGAANHDDSATGVNIGTDVWLSPSVLVARFETPTEGPSDLPTSWSTRREFVLVGSLQPFGGGTDDYFPANASLTENHGVLLVIDGDSVTVMTVTESAN